MVLTISPAFAGLLSESEIDYLQNKQTIRFVSQTNYPPFEFLGPDGDHTGMCIELVRWIATEFGFKAHFSDTAFKEAQDIVLSKKADVITSLFYSEKRDKLFDFTDVMFQVPASIFVIAERPDIKDINDLQGKTIAMQVGDYAQEYLESKDISFITVYAENFAEATNLVITGKADVVIGDEQIVLFHIFSNNLSHRIKKVGEPLYIGQNCMAGRDPSPVLISILNKGIKLARETGVLDQIYRKWIGVRYQPNESSLVNFLPLIVIIAATVLLLTLLIWFWNLKLRQQVAERTAALSNSERTVRTILTASPVGVGLMRKNRMDWHNQAMTGILGYQPSDLKGLSTKMLYADESEFRRAIQAVKEASAHGKKAVIETKWMRKDGSTFDCLLRFTTLEGNGDRSIAVAIVEDITERKRAENELREAHERLNATLNTLPDILFEVDRKGCIYSYHVPVVESAAIDTHQYLMRNVRDFFPAPAADVVMKAVDETARNGRYSGAIYSIEVSGQTRWFELSMAVEGDPQKPDAHMIALARDITERLKSEEEKSQLETQLRHAQKMKAVGTLAGGVAHDFNNLLQAINGYTQLLLLESRNDDGRLRKLTAIEKAAARASQLVKQLLTFSRKVDIKRQPIDLNQEVGQVIELLERIIPKMIQIEIHPTDDLTRVNADPAQIEQIILNLATNAADAMPDGGKLVIKTENVNLSQVDCQTHPDLAPGEYVLLTFSDTGHGIDEETLNHIFDPFFTTKETGQGTGLGLASVYGIVKSHDGAINCFSEVGRGTTFRIYLPAIKPGTEDEYFCAKTSPLEGGHETILVVDDEEPIREIAGEMLEYYGYRVFTAPTGEDALALFNNPEVLIDLVILDLGMPGMGGHKCLGELLNIDSSLKVIISSGYSSQGQEKTTLDSGAYAFIGKPYQMADLIKLVKQALSR